MPESASENQAPFATFSMLDEKKAAVMPVHTSLRRGEDGCQASVPIRRVCT